MCDHRNTVVTTSGTMSFNDGAVSDDIQEQVLCLDCLQVVDDDTLFEDVIHILRSTPYKDPFRAIRMKTADQLELQMLGLGDPANEEAARTLAGWILEAVKNVHTI